MQERPSLHIDRLVAGLREKHLALIDTQCPGKGLSVPLDLNGLGERTGMQDRNSLGLDLATLYTQVARKKRQGFLTQQVRPDLCPIRSVRLGIIASQDNQVGALKLVLVFLMPNTGRDQHQSGQCANNHSIPKRTGR